MRQSRKLGLFGRQGKFTWNKYSITTTYSTDLADIVQVGNSLSWEDSTALWYASSTSNTTISSVDGTFSLYKNTRIGTASDLTRYYTDDSPNESGSSMGSQTIRKVNSVETITNGYRYWYYNYEAKSIDNLTFVGTVTSKDIFSYPWNGKQDGYYYKLVPWEEIVCNGTYSSSYLLGLDEVYYKFYEITDDTTISTPKTTKTHLWICGPGGNGGQGRYYKYGGGGGGGYFVNSPNVELSDSTNIVIGKTAGNSSSFGNIVVGSGENGGNYSGTTNTDGSTGSGGDGGSGGGAGGARYSVSQGTNGVGQHESSIPFYTGQLSSSIFSSFTTPLCPGGNGGNVTTSSYLIRGYLGGLDGADATEINSAAANAQNATVYGGGGGGAVANGSSIVTGGTGYQGVCYLAMPITKMFEYTGTFNISSIEATFADTTYEQQAQQAINKLVSAGATSYTRSYLASGQNEIFYYFNFGELLNSKGIIENIKIDILMTPLYSTTYTNYMEVSYGDKKQSITVPSTSAKRTVSVTLNDVTLDDLNTNFYIRKYGSRHIGYVDAIDVTVTYLTSKD